MMVNHSTKRSLEKSWHLLVASSVSLGMLGLDPVLAQAPAAGQTAQAQPADASAPAVPIAPAATAQPAKVAPPAGAADSQVTNGQPARNPHPTAIKPGTNVYNGTNASTLDFANRNPTLPKPKEGPAVPWKMASFVENNPSYSVDVQYPQFDPIKGNDPSKLNEEIKRYVAAQIDALRPSMPAKMAHSEGPRPLSYIKGLCVVSLYNESLCSLSVDLTSYAYQSAHPIEALTTFNYRLDTNQQFPLKDVFRSDFKFIPAVSKICIGLLTQGLDEEGTEWAKRGAAPEEKNFVKFQLTDKDLNIVFDPYTVDNGADGFRSVPIEWNRIRGNVSQDKPFHKLVTH